MLVESGHLGFSAFLDHETFAYRHTLTPRSAVPIGATLTGFIFLPGVDPCPASHETGYIRSKWRSQRSHSAALANSVAASLLNQAEVFSQPRFISRVFKEATATDPP